MGFTEGLNWRICIAISACAIGSAFQHGYNTGVVNAPEDLIEDWIKSIKTDRSGIIPEDHEVKLIFSILVSVFCVGGMIGGSITGFIADRFGRRNGLLLNNALVLLSAVLMGFSRKANSYELFIAGRLLIGINCGLNAGLAPMYLAEISPVNLRGSIGTIYQLVITISILLSQILGLDYILGTETQWPILFGLIMVPGILQISVLPLCPESPKYLLLTKGRDLQAQQALTWLRGTIEVHTEMEEMHQQAEKMKTVNRVTLKELFTDSCLRAPLIIAVVIMLAQQLSGINAVMFFSTKIFEMAGLGKTESQYATIGMGGMNVLMTMASLVLVERSGRRTLLLVGFAGMLFVTSLLTLALAFTKYRILWVSYASIALVIAFVVMFATGPGSIPWFLVTELFNQSARPAASSVAVATNWTANFLVGLGFLPLAELLEGYVFVIFVILQALFLVFIYFKVPETKNKTIEEITAMFRQQL